MEDRRRTSSGRQRTDSDQVQSRRRPSAGRGRRKNQKEYKFIKYKIYVFAVSLMLMGIIALIIPLRPKESAVEKRTLTKFPEFSVERFLSGEFLDGLTTWYADTFPFREKFLAANTKMRTAYGIQSDQIHGTIEAADDVPVKRIQLTDILLPTMKTEFEEIQESMREVMADQEAAYAANGGKKRREITAVPEQVGSVYVADDTAFSLYGFSQDGANQYIDAVSALANKVGEGVTVYDIVVPTSTAIYLDLDFQKELGCSDQQEAIKYIYENMDQKVVTIDAFSALKEHSDEYLYFRTDHHWTALGAYYTYSQLMRAKGVSPTALSKYETMVFENFIGTLYSSSNQAPSLAANPDTVTAYVPLATNDMTYTDTEGNEIDYDIIHDVSDWDAGAKYNCFIAGDQPLEEIDNPEIEDGSACVVIKESFGNAFVPFLVDHYDKVYVVDYRYYPEGLTDLIRDKGIQDVIFMNNIAAATTSSLVSNIEEIVNFK